MIEMMNVNDRMRTIFMYNVHKNMTCHGTKNGVPGDRHMKLVVASEPPGRMNETKHSLLDSKALLRFKVSVAMEYCVQR